MKKNNTYTILLFLTVILLITLVSCDTSKKFREQEKALIESYLASHPNLNFELKPSGLYYLEKQAGTGLAPITNDTIFFKQTVQFLDDTYHYNGQGATDSTIVDEYMIDGFREAICSMKVGGKSMFIVPSKLAWGSIGYYDIPGYTPLLYNVELVHVHTVSGK
jgi:FKBP-type peptidyl-prolyl cis-trans isomerase FkpA